MDCEPDSAASLVEDATTVMGRASWWGGGDIWSMSGVRPMRATSAALAWVMARALAARRHRGPHRRCCGLWPRGHLERTRRLPDCRPRVAASCVTAERYAPALSPLTTASRAATMSSQPPECNLSSQTVSETRGIVPFMGDDRAARRPAKVQVRGGRAPKNAPPPPKAVNKVPKPPKKP